VAKSLRAIAALRATPIIAVTSYAMAGDREKAIASGCSGYIEKPIDPDTFIADIEAFCASVAAPERSR
jgi:two-component system cell cycle response regulator DivK